ncbi:hypothetical protein Victoria_0051 [Pseudomonas phage Victoria]|uniref:Uncharacterized protein n=1 Tax=Pseudomonas phage Epa15 TaxID=2733395 RepID=A0A7T0M7E4_9CAUD|nr:hypothetical protein [Pseudomonas phage Epa15]WFG37087.1 hypothetical protein 7712_00074 [Pseudomonas phage bmx-p2]WPK40796.1 hypothetical protein Victoria_0051 [Pseudomonas phage Victoria]
MPYRRSGFSRFNVDKLGLRPDPAARVPWPERRRFNIAVRIVKQLSASIFDEL